MCLAVPGKVVEITGDGELRMGKVDFAGVQRQACLAYVPEVAGRGLRARPRRLRDLADRRAAGDGDARGARGDRRAVRAGRAAGGRRGALAAGSEELMRHVDEYRDPAAVDAVVQKIHATVTRPWTLMEVCGGQTHSILKFGMDELLPASVRLVHGPGCPGLRDAARADRPRDRHRLAPRRDLLLVRRHAARPGLARRPAEGEGARRRRADRLLAARRRAPRAARTRSARSCSSPWASRPRPRPTPWPSTAPRAEGLDELLGARRPRPRAAGARGAPLDARTRRSRACSLPATCAR